MPSIKFPYNNHVNRRTLSRLVPLLGVIFFLLVLSWEGTSAQDRDCRYFPETGHKICGEFRVYYDLTENAEFYFGYPISVRFPGLNGNDVQFFDRVRFEFRPEFDTLEERVYITHLGNLSYEIDRGQNLEFPKNTPACETYPPSGPEAREHYVCFAFLEFFKTHGGVSRFGFPISDFKWEDGRIVQYFNWAKFSWHPELDTGQRVQIVDLGRIYFYNQRYDTKYLNPSYDGIVQDIIQIKTRAFTEKPLISEGESQTLFVIVQDQALQAVEGASVTFTMKLPDGVEESILMDPTDANGVSELTFSVPSQTIGIVELSVYASHFDFEDETKTSFRIWY